MSFSGRRADAYLLQDTNFKNTIHNISTFCFDRVTFEMSRELRGCHFTVVSLSQQQYWLENIIIKVLPASSETSAEDSNV